MSKTYIYIKIYDRDGEILLAACDKEVLGERFSEGEFHLNVNSDFYSGELRDIAELSAILRGVTIANLTGNNVVDYAIENGFVNRDNIQEIAGIKHAQIVAIS